MKHTGLLDDWKIANDAFKKTQESTDVPVINTPAPIVKAAVSKTPVAVSDKPPPRPPTAYALVVFLTRRLCVKAVTPNYRNP
jgi:hypothetical protein